MQWPAVNQETWPCVSEITVGAVTLPHCSPSVDDIITTLCLSAAPCAYIRNELTDQDQDWICVFTLSFILHSQPNDIDIMASCSYLAGLFHSVCGITTLSLDMVKAIHWVLICNHEILLTFRHQMHYLAPAATNTSNDQVARRSQESFIQCLVDYFKADFDWFNVLYSLW